MLLEDIYKIVEKGAQKPLIFWAEDCRKIAKKIVPKLKNVENSIEDGTEVKKNLEKLIDSLVQSNLNEYDLALGASFISHLFSEGQYPEHKDLIYLYKNTVNVFYSDANKRHIHDQLREEMKSSLSLEEQKQYDLRLFKNEGMTYCLEYYLALYKALIDAPNKLEKRKFIESKAVNLGFGDLPGLLEDFKSDEVLNKFIYSILDDQLRFKLLKAYFDAKLVIMLIEIKCDETGKCEGIYIKVTLDKVIEAFRQLILVLFETFMKIGIKQLESHFFQPYGKKPLIENIKI